MQSFRFIQFKKYILIGVSLLIAIASGEVFSQGFIVAKDSKQKPEVIKVLSYETKISINNNIAHVVIEQVFCNTGSKPVQGNYYFVFPSKTRVNSCTLELEGAVFNGELITKKQSEKLCFEFIKDGLSPSFFDLTERQWYRGNIYQIPANGKRAVTFKYTQILVEHEGLARLDFPRYPVALQRDYGEIMSDNARIYTDALAINVQPLDYMNTSIPIDVSFKKKLKVSINTDYFIKNIYSPNSRMEIFHKSANRVDILVNNEDLLSNDFVLLYAQDERDISCNVLTYKPDNSSDGYFMLLASSLNPMPQSKILSKDVIFVLDTSGSMEGEKFGYAKDGLKRCIMSLNDSDYFNIITYGSDVKIYQKKLVKASEFNLNACEYVEELTSGGGTNINEALLTALSIKPHYGTIKQVIFITDGLPTVGVTDIFTIQENVRKLNLFNFQIHSFAIVREFDEKLLHGLKMLTNGHMEYVENPRVFSDKFVSFFESINLPVLGSAAFFVSGTELYDVLGNNHLNIYQDDQIILVGRYRNTGMFDLYLNGKDNAGEKRLHFDMDFKQSDFDNNFIRNIWRKRKLGFTLENNELSGALAPSNFENEMPVFLEGYKFYNEKNSPQPDDMALQKVRVLKRLKEAAVFKEELNSKTRIIGDKIFKLASDGYWEDTAFSSIYEENDNLLHIKYGSEAYFNLAKNISDLRPFLAISSHLKLNYADYLIKIDKSGLEEINNFPF